MGKIVIAIDGYSSCGKSTLAKELSRRLNYIYIDTGAMYRAVTLYALRNDLIIEGELNSAALVASLNDINVSFSYNRDTNTSDTFLNGENVEQEIRGIAVSKQVSKVAQVREVRTKMVDLQRKMGEDKGLVMDGRDIGSVVFPNAELKFFMTANEKIRAQRRYDELKAKGDDISFDEVIANIQDRDMKDTSRAENPLVQADDAIVIDNSDITQEQQLDLALGYVQEKLDKTQA